MSLAVVAVHFNPAGYSGPRRNLMRFVRQLTSVGIRVFIGELAYNDEPFFLDAGEALLRLRTSRRNVMWHKENLVNLVVECLPPKYEFVAWIDPDIWFVNQQWANEAIHKLEHYSLVQLFAKASWTNREGQIFREMQGAAASGLSDTRFYHPGFAWGARRELWNIGGGLGELAIIGGGDSLLASACLNGTVHDWINYPDWKKWTRNVSTWVKTSGGVGFVEGGVVHEWHGAEAKRNYVSRHSIVKDVEIENIVYRRPDGLLEFNELASERLRGDITSYFRGRQEDLGSDKLE